MAISMSYEVFSELMMLTKVHFEAWLSAWYMQKIQSGKPAKNKPQADSQYQESSYEPENASEQMF